MFSWGSDTGIPPLPRTHPKGKAAHPRSHTCWPSEIHLDACYLSLAPGMQATWENKAGRHLQIPSFLITVSKYISLTYTKDILRTIFNIFTDFLQRWEMKWKDHHRIRLFNLHQNSSDFSLEFWAFGNKRHFTWMHSGGHQTYTIHKPGGCSSASSLVSTFSFSRSLLKWKHKWHLETFCLHYKIKFSYKLRWFLMLFSDSNQLRVALDK